MYQFFESIKAEDGIVFNLDYHQKRVNLAFQHYYPNVRPLALDLLIEQQPIPDGLVKCRISYNSNDQKIEFVPYKIRTIESLKLIKGDSIEYSHKFMDRTQLDKLFDHREECDDIPSAFTG